MRISAIRAAEFRCFSEPVALEGLSGGLDLLVGSNEVGKSTLLHALNTALFRKHRASGAEIESLRPYRGGAPLVEVDFCVGGEAWRVRKRFLAERTAEVISLDTGALTRGADAEAQLEQLLQLGSAGGRFPLLWLAQGESRKPPLAIGSGEEALRAAVDREVAAASGGQAARQLRRRVSELLDALVTPNRAQPRGRYQVALRSAETADVALAGARRLHTEAESLLQRLAALDVQSRPLSDPAVAEQRQARLRGAEAALQAARVAITERDRARAAASEARAHHVAAEAKAGRMRQRLAEIEQLGRLDAAAAEEAAAITAALRAVEATLAEAMARATATQQALHRAQAALGRARQRELAERLATARSAAGEIAALRAARDRLPSDEDAMRQARALAGRIAEGEARLAATSANVRISYLSGAEGLVTVDGRPLGEAERLIADGPLALDIAGVGRITIEPGRSVDHERLREDTAAARSALRELLSASGVADVAALESGVEQARSLATRIAMAEARLRALAPDGLDGLERLTSSAIAVELPGPVTDTAVTEADLPRLSAAAEAAARAHRLASEEREVLRQREAARASAASERQRRRSEIEAELPSMGVRDDEFRGLCAAAQATAGVLDDALRVAAATEVRAPDADAVARLEADVAAARDAIRTAAEAGAAIAAERARIEGELDGTRREDVPARLASSEAEAERASRVLADVVEEVAALRLLQQELDAAEAGLRDAYLVPVTNRLAPYLELVFPGASVALDARFGIERLDRGGTSEALADVSDGTQEQVAVLVRLALARLLADQGAGVPLILDDPLVWADDRRIEHMHRALELAARFHQVIVMSCREQAFGGLAAHRLTLRPWRPDGGR